MPDYEILDWAYRNVTDFRGKDAVQSQIDDFASGSSDGGKKWEDFRNSNDWFNIVSKGGIVFNDEVETENDSYASEIGGEIDRANDEADLDRIELDTEYESDTITELEGSIEGRRSELRETGSETIETAIDEISSATTIEEINEAIAEAPTIGSIRKQFPDLAGELSLAQAEAAERKFGLENP